MIEKASSETHFIYTLLLLILFLSFGFAILTAWSSTDRCARLQAVCGGEKGGTRLEYCILWLNSGTEPVDAWPKDLKTCTIEGTKKIETDCPRPNSIDECRLMVVGSVGTTSTTT